MSSAAAWRRCTMHPSPSNSPAAQATSMALHCVIDMQTIVPHIHADAQWPLVPPCAALPAHGSTSYLALARDQPAESRRDQDRAVVPPDREDAPLASGTSVRPEEVWD